MMQGGLEKTLESKLEGLGEDFLMSYLAGPLGAAGRIGQAFKTGGMSELEGLGADWLQGFQPGPLTDSPLVNSVVNVLRRRIHGEHGQKTRAAWARTDWAYSRDDWLDNHWRHDWRSQPRDQHGRWIPGRLQYIVESMQYRGRRMGRVRLRKRQLKRIARARGRRSARKLFKQIRKTLTGAAR